MICRFGVITFFTPIFLAKQQEIRAEDEKETFPARIGLSHARKLVPVSRFLEQPFALSIQRGGNIPGGSTSALKTLLK
jgi:hypothetical protein